MDLLIRISPDEAAKTVVNEVVYSSFSGKLIDQYNISSPEGECIVIVLEKYFMRNSSRASLTVTIDNLTGTTRVHAVGSGGGQGVLFSFDWGSGNSLENKVINALEKYNL